MGEGKIKYRGKTIGRFSTSGHVHQSIPKELFEKCKNIEPVYVEYATGFNGEIDITFSKTELNEEALKEFLEKEEDE